MTLSSIILFEHSSSFSLFLLTRACSCVNCWLYFLLVWYRSLCVVAVCMYVCVNGFFVPTVFDKQLQCVFSSPYQLLFSRVFCLFATHCLCVCNCKCGVCYLLRANCNNVYGNF